MNAILALSVRHISLNPHVAPDICHERADALKYYYETLHYLHKAMQFDSFKTSLELLATSLIVSTYEMLDGSRRDWERHLKGVFWIQRSQNIHGDSGGLKQANWWAWLCQDVWAAFREKRKVFSFWKHPRTFDQLNEHELACRAVFIFAKAVNYCSKEETEADKDSFQGRIARADALTRMLDEWQGLLTVKFSPLPIASGSESEVFPPIWIHPSCFGTDPQRRLVRSCADLACSCGCATDQCCPYIDKSPSTVSWRAKRIRTKAERDGEMCRNHMRYRKTLN